MPRTQVYSAVTERLEILDPEGVLDEALAPTLEPDEIRELYADMVRMRA